MRQRSAGASITKRSRTMEALPTNDHSTEIPASLQERNQAERSLFLVDFAIYRCLVIELYRTSLPMILGNSLEWLDFSIYGYSSSEIAAQLFGGSRSAYWASFGLGFAVRPLGAYVLGKLSDERSRNTSFILSMLAMSTSTALMSLIPAVCGAQGVTLDSYCVHNPLGASIPAIILRCLQGFSAGAAAGGVNVIQTELWSTDQRKPAIAQAVGVQNVSGGGASMLSAAIVYGLRVTMGEVSYAAWGWRLAFWIVVPPSIFASYLLHKSTPESNTYAAETDRTVSERSIELQGFRSNSEEEEFMDEEAKILHPNRREAYAVPPNEVSLWCLLSVMIFSQFAIAGFNNLSVFLVEFAQTNYGVTPNTSTLMQVVGKGVQLLMTPVAAALGDIKGWFWTCVFGGALCTILAMPMMLVGTYGGVGAAWFLVSGCLPMVSTFWILNAPLLATSVFPVECRSRYTSLVLATAAAIQGFLPLVLEELSNIYAQGVTLTIIAGLGTMGIVWIRNKAKQGKVIIHQRPELY